MAGPVRRRLARLIYRVVAGSLLPEDPAPPAVTPKPRAEQPDEVPGERLTDVLVAYQEVLDATKHQDDKIGRFMAGIAFLIAGALVFTNSTVLQATYLVGDTSLPLPALALGAFLVLIVLSLLFYLLAMSAPLTIPPAARTTERSRQYFLVIAGETHTTWRRLWTQPASSGELRSELADENVDEIRNLAFCTDLKYERSNEGSALFVLALLFFLLGIVLSIDVVQHLEIPDDPSQATRPPADLDWSLPLRVLVGSLLALFPFALLYQRLRAAQRSTFDDLVRQAKERLRRIGPASGSNVLRRALAKRRWQPLHGLLLAYPIVVLPTILADQGRTRANEMVSVAIGLAAIVAAGCFRAILVPAVPTEPPIPGSPSAAGFPGS